MSTSPASSLSLAVETADILSALGVAPERLRGGARAARSPITGEVLAQVHDETQAGATEVIAQAQAALLQWRVVPPSKR
ncbi:MAG: aldehyde dehydrogenase family protein, partial [Bradyrhizobium sp.]